MKGRVPFTRRATRRDFLKAAGAACAFPYVIPASALGTGGAVAPSERLAMGCIGTGSQGRGNMEQFLQLKEVQVVAVCDVDRKRRHEARDIVNAAYRNKDCADYNDFRELLDRNGLDVVSLALPDHWHSIPAIMAANRKLDIYAEKPLALTIAEGQAIVRAVEKNNVIWQTGSWQRSQENFHRACELVRNGVIGEVHTVEVGLPTGKTIAPQAEMPVPEGFDYDLWLGPAPYAPYTEMRCHWNFRWITDYSGGQLTDWIGHHGDIANWAMGTEHTGPTRVEGQGVYPRDGLWNAVTEYRFTCIYEAGVSPVAPKGFTMVVSDAFPMGAKFHGEKDWIYVDRGELTASRDEILATELGDNAIRLYESRHHGRNFVDCVRARKETITPVQAAHRAITIGHLGNIAMQLGRPVVWDPEAENFGDDHQANRMLSRAMRGPWHI
jgi:predicted dehydrogenase